MSQASRAHEGSAGRKASPDRRERPGPLGLKAPQGTMAPKATLGLSVSPGILALLEKSDLGARMVLRVTEERTESQASLDLLGPLGKTGHLGH